MLPQLLALDGDPGRPDRHRDRCRATPPSGEAYAADPLVWHGPFKRPTLEALSATIDAIRRGRQARALPTLWVHGEDDQLVPIEASRGGHRADLGGEHADAGRRTPGARHEVFNETNKDEVLDDVTDFIDEQIGHGEATTSFL